MDPDGEYDLCSQLLDTLTNDNPSEDGLTNDSPSSNTHLDAPTAADGFHYAPADVALLQSIEAEAAFLFPPGKIYDSPIELRQDVRSFAYQKGFEVTSHGSRISCTRCTEPKSYMKKREEKVLSGLVPIENQRKHRKSTRCGCPFKICHSRLNQKDKSSISVKITKTSIYRHDKGCLPSRSQLFVEKRKSGAYTKSINESQIKTILSLLKTGEKVPPRTLRKLLRPLFPGGTTLDYQFLYNFHLKAQRMMKKRWRSRCDDYQFRRREGTY